MLKSFNCSIRVGVKGTFSLGCLKVGVGDLTLNLKSRTKVILHPLTQSAYRTIQNL